MKWISEFYKENFIIWSTGVIQSKINLDATIPFQIKEMRKSEEKVQFKAEIISSLPD